MMVLSSGARLPYNVDWRVESGTFAPNHVLVAVDEFRSLFQLVVDCTGCRTTAGIGELWSVAVAPDLAHAGCEAQRSVEKV
jgi:hypothetical protein